MWVRKLVGGFCQSVRLAGRQAAPFSVKGGAVTHRTNRNYEAELDDDMLERIIEVTAVSDVIETLSNKRTNWIASFDRTGVQVETERSRALEAGPRLVPAWMIVVAWEQLCKNGTLSHIELLTDLKVVRSAFVCALLAQFHDVVVVQDRPAVLERVAMLRSTRAGPKAGL